MTHHSLTTAVVWPLRRCAVNRHQVSAQDKRQQGLTVLTSRMGSAGDRRHVNGKQMKRHQRRAWQLSLTCNMPCGTVR